MPATLRWADCSSGYSITDQVHLTRREADGEDVAPVLPDDVVDGGRLSIVLLVRQVLPRLGDDLGARQLGVCHALSPGSSVEDVRLPGRR